MPLRGLAASRALRRASWIYRAYCVEQALLALRDAVERKYNPNQPRVPAGNPDRGQWTDAGGGSGRSPRMHPRLPRSAQLALGLSVEEPEERILVAQNDRPGYLTDVLPRPRNLPGTVRDLSDIPLERPSTIQLVNAFGKFVAYEAAEYIMKQSGASAGSRAFARRALRSFFLAAEIAPWIKEDLWPVIESYNDPPKSLKELQDAAAKRRPGYENHHIVERNSKQLGEDARIKSPENVVSIPTFKHHLITGRFSRKSKEYGGLSLRSYLKGKSWEERYRYGLEIMVEQGVLKP